MRHIGTTLSPAIAATALLVGTIPARGDADFERGIAPLIVQHCLECHGESKASGGLVLTSGERLLKGGDSGAAIVPGKPEESLLLQRLVDGEMPPVKHGKSQHLPDDEIARFRAWIAAGAVWPEGRVLDPYERTTATRGGRDWWSLQAVVRPDVPVVQHADRVATPVDAFILQMLEARGWDPAPPADRRALIRRLSYDLIGLPPSYAETQAFAADDSPGAYEQLVDRLLASPHYSERWGRYWLDLVRYADTCGYERDQEKPGVWKYRDWVVAALNNDMPYDRFILEQLAGDELPDRSEQTVIATAFLRLGTWNDEPNDPDEYKYERLEDMVHATGTAFLALTVKCARCHDHKFDPIPQVDYYRMASAFWAGYIEPRERQWLGGPNKDELGFDVFGWTDRGRDVPPLHLLKSGDPKHPQDVVEPAQLSLIPALATPVAPPPEGTATTHRRVQLAEWITDPRHPLTARVLVNRLWQHHFGQGLVASTDNFGFTGDRPSHPELLDWLADEFVHPSIVTSNGETAADLAGKAWTIKRMHKLLVMSSTYRQSSGHARYDEYAQVDSGNRDCWHAPRQRLDADALRDSLLVASGQIDLRIGGPSFRPTVSSEALEGLSRKDNAWKASPPEEQRRRSLYIYLQRSLLPPLMTTFDQSDTTLPCSRRDVTTVAPQALALLNNDFVHGQSAALAQRVVEEAGSDDQQRIDAAWILALGRVPSETERAAARGHLGAQAERFSSTPASQPATADSATPPILEGLVLCLTAVHGVTCDEAGRVAQWADASGAGHDAAQPIEAQRPILVAAGLNGRPTLQFDGAQRFLKIAGQVLTSQQHTLFVVATDRGAGAHRGIFSNWDGAAGNSVTSAFLGTTGDATVRFSDAFANAGTLRDKSQRFVITAVSGTMAAVVLQNGQELARGSALPPRTLTTGYVIGQQGNINGEYWTGEIAAVVVFDRELPDDERGLVERWLAAKYGLALETPRRDPRQLALESLCHVLLNTNEFLYVD